MFSINSFSKPLSTSIFLTVLVCAAFSAGVFTQKYVWPNTLKNNQRVSIESSESAVFFQAQYQPINDDSTEHDSALALITKANEMSALKGNVQFKLSAKALTEQPTDVLNKSMLNITLGYWAMKDSIAALEFALVQSNKQELADLVAEISGKNQDVDMLNWLQSNKTHPLHDYLVLSYFIAFSKEAPTVALDTLQTAYDESEQADVLTSIIDVWAKQDAEAVFVWLESREKSTLTVDLQNRAINNYIQQNPLDAARLVSNLRKGDNKNQLISSVADTLAKQDVYDAIDWAETLPDEEKMIAISSVMNSWAREGIPEAALDYLLEHQEIQSDDTVLYSTITNVAESDTNLLIERLQEFSDDNKNKVIKEIASALLNKDKTEEYELWYQTLPEGPQREAASIPVVQSNIRRNPERAFKYAENIISMELRQRYLVEAARSWANFDVAQARAAIDASVVLSPEQKVEILAGLDN